MEVGFHTVDGVRVRCAESTSLSAPSILLTSPWPESVYAFARVCPSLAAAARLVAVDLPGSYEGDRFVESMRYARAYPDELPRLAERLPGINTPVLIIAGRRDRVVPLGSAEFLDERLPNSALVAVEAGHVVWEERPGEYASLIEDWVAGGYRAAAQAGRPGP